jgi:tetratricopeptide (TPR) repeat protein
MGDPSIDKLVGEAVAHHQGGRVGEARRIYERVLAIDSNNAQAMHLLGALTAQEKNYEQALQLMNRAAILEPNVAGFHYNMGVLLAKMGRWGEAAKAFGRVSDLQPTNAEAMLALGDALFNLNRAEEAVAVYEKAMAIKPAGARAYQNLAVALRGAGRWDDAVAACRRALAIEPENAEILNTLSVLLSSAAKLEEAIAAAEAALKIKPNYPPALNSLVIAYLAGGRVSEALATARQAIEIEKNLPTLRWNLACALLKSGQLIEGFAEYEHRGVAAGAAPARLWKQPRWDGRDLGGKEILVYADQGIGDTIFFARYLPVVVGRGGRVILECQESLVGLMREIPGVELVIVRGADLPAFEYQSALESLPMVFQTTMQTIPAEVPYIRAATDRSGRWKQRLSGGGGGGGGGGDGGLKVGLCWGGNPRNTYNHFRSMTARDLAPILAAGGAASVSFFSLQKGPAASTVGAEIGAGGRIGEVRLVDFTAELNDFAETAALIDNLDLVISVDTAVAHLAGAMGKPTWVPLSTAADWRYFEDREDSPWYPTMRLFRQKKLGDWAEPIRALAAALADLAGGRGS